MKIIILMIITIIGICKNAQGQATIPVSRTTWNAGAPTGWTDNGTSSYTTAFACSGNNGGQLNSTGDYYQVFYDIGASSLVFTLKSTAAFTGQFDVQESADGSSWTTLQSYTAGSPVPTSCTSYTLTLNCSSRYVRFFYTTRVQNITIDDVAITQGVCSSCTPPADPAGTISGTTPACTNTTLSYSSPSATTYWQTSASGTSTATATTSNLVVSTSGNYYVRTFDGTCWSTNSVGPYAVVVNTAVAITTQPATTTVTVCSGTAFAALTVAATGTSLTYQWYSNTANSNSGGTLIAGATSASYTPPNATAGTTYYYCIVSGASPCSAVTSNVSGPRIVNQTPTAPNAPTPAANPGCSSTTLTTNAAPAGVTFYWQGTTSGGTSTASPTSASYTASVVGTNTYYVRAQDDVNACWSTQTSVAVTINTPITITTQPTDKIVCTGTNTSMAIVGAGAAPKQWQFSTDGGATFNNVVADGGISTNFTTATMSLTNPPIGYNGYIYQCVVSVAGCPTVTSNTASLTVHQTPAAPSNPVAATNPACSGTSLNTMVPPAGVTWYWQGTTNPGTSTAVSTSSIDNITTSGTYYVRARTDGTSCWSTTSGSLAVTINTPPTISSQPTNVTQCAGANATYSVTATGTSLTYQWQLDAGGGFGNLANNATYSGVTTATLTVTGVTAGMNGYLYRCIVSGASPCAAANSNSAQLIITAAGTPATAASAPATSNVGCNGFNITWTNGSGSNRLVVVKAGGAPTGPTDGVSYTANANFGSGTDLGASSFAVYTGTGSSVFVYGLTASTSYTYSIYEFNGCSLNYLTSGGIPGGTQATGACSSTAGVTALYVDACGTSSGCGYEGNNELIWGVSGSYAIPVRASSPVLHYSGSTNPTVTYISTYAANAANTVALNTAAGVSCGSTTFIDASTVGFIPPGANFLMANSCLCDPVPYDLTNLCGSGPIYVIYGTNASWTCNTTGGIFGNSAGSGSGYFDTDFTAVIPGLDNEYFYNKVTLASGDGAYVTFDAAGGAATSYGSGACVVPAIVLPIHLESFSGSVVSNSIALAWKTVSEENFNHFELEKSEDGTNYKLLAEIVSSFDNRGSNYKFIDENPVLGNNYYRLFSVDNDGKKTYQNTITVDFLNNGEETFVISYADDKVLIGFKETGKNTSVSLFNLTGQLVKEFSEAEIMNGVIKIENKDFVKGMYIIRVNQKLSSKSDKIIIR